MSGVMKKEKKPQARVQFDFSTDSLKKLDQLVTVVHATTRAEVIRRALTLYTEMLEAENRGAKILLREADGTMIQLMLLS
jgi:hypothetical protein